MADLAVTNTFSNGIVISSSQMNTNFSDVVNFINNRNSAAASWTSLAVSANGSIGGTLIVTGATTLSSTLAVVGVSSFADGTAALPSLTFSSDPNTGIYRIGADALGLSTAGVVKISIDSGGTTTFVEGIREKDGLVSAPSYTFTNDVDTGFYRVGADQIGTALGGVDRLTITPTALIVASTQVSMASGSASAPAYSFTGDLNCGIYRIGADSLGITTAGVLKVTIDSGGTITLLEGMRGKDGTAVAPAYTFVNDVDTGVFLSGANQYSITTNGAETARFDASATARDTRFMIYDVDNATLERVTVGVADSGGVGFKLLRVPN